jgi:hypothetical protein
MKKRLYVLIYQYGIAIGIYHHQAGRAGCGFVGFHTGNNAIVFQVSLDMPYIIKGLNSIGVLPWKSPIRALPFLRMR